MKRTNIFNMLLFLLIPLLVCQFVSDIQAQGVKKIVTVGYIHTEVSDGGDEGEGSLGWSHSGDIYYGGPRGGYRDGLFSSKAVCLGLSTFTDTTGTTFTPKVTTHGQWESDLLRLIMPVPDEVGWTIHRYMRYAQPAVEVDGLRLEDPYPFNLSDHVDPEYIAAAGGGNADVFIESFINSNIGISIHQRVMTFTNKNHEKYDIRSFVFKNTGNGDIDPTIEYPDNSLTGFYFLMQDRHEESPKPWVTYIGERTTDDLRIMLGYTSRQPGDQHDNFGRMNVENGFIERPWYKGEAILFVSAADPVTGRPITFQNDPDQPHMTGFQDVDMDEVTVHSDNLTPGQQLDLYNVMVGGFSTYPEDPDPDNTAPDVRPGHHSIDSDERGYKFPNDAPWFGFSISGLWACGPYNLEMGDSLIIVRSDVLGTISAVKAYEVGRAWINDDAHWPEDPAAPGYDIPGGPADNLPPVYTANPDLYTNDVTLGLSGVTNWAKDCWVASGYDSVIQTTRAAQWAHDNDWAVPMPPPPPSVKVTSSTGSILVEWGDESEAASDFAGYRVYRAQGNWYPRVVDGGTDLIGAWEQVAEYSGAATHSFEDTTPIRGFGYYYYVSAFDNASGNDPDFHGRQESLESSKFWNMTTQPGFLTKPGGTLETIKIVPNPYHYAGKAGVARYTGDQRDQILFLDVPEECTIKIYTESGDLVKTIEHTGSGDASWGKLEEEYSATDTGQKVVSGIYIAVFETPEGDQTIKKFVIIR